MKILLKTTKTQHLFSTPMDLDFNAQSFACEENKSQEDDLKTLQMS